jgi:hypothetical protein
MASPAPSVASFLSSLVAFFSNSGSLVMFAAIRRPSSGDPRIRLFRIKRIR